LVRGTIPTALWRYLEQKEALHAGRTPRPETTSLTVKELCNSFLNAKQDRVHANELTQRSWAEYKQTCDLLIKQFGKGRLVDDLGPEDFAALRAKMSKRWGPVRLGNAITRVKTVFKNGLDNGLIEKHVRYGGEFRKPGKAVLRRHRAANGEKMLEADQLHRLIGAADVPMRAMIMLALNADFGNGDCAQLPLSALDLERGWVRAMPGRRRASNAAARCGRKRWQQSRKSWPRNLNRRSKHLACCSSRSVAPRGFTSLHRADVSTTSQSSSLTS
jgi:hypothetical protein